MAALGYGKVREKREEILTLWEARSLKEIPSACHSGTLALRNSLPKYLDHLSLALAENRKMDDRSVGAHDEDSIRIGRLHGADRAGNSSYMLTEVISEYHILREVIFQVLEEKGPIESIHRDLILDSIERAVNDAAVRFSEVHAEIQQKFINTLTHDLKNPISAAKTSAEFIAAHPDRPEICLKAATRVVRSMVRLDGMIHDLLDSGRLRAGEPLSLHYAQCDLENVVREVVEEMTVVNGDRFIFSPAGAVDGNWGADGIRRATENLLGNAVKYATEGSLIRVSLSREGSEVELSVHNEGAPISAADLPFLFEQHRRTKSSLESPIAGWGLGLTVVKGVVEAHRGKIQVESAAGHGTTFRLFLPVSDCGAAS